MLHRRSKLNIDNKILLYKTAIRPIITYSCPVFTNIANVHKAKLQTLQNKILRMIMNVPWFTRTTTIHENVNMETLSEFMIKLKTKFEQKIANIPDYNI